jgi:hypothetical protein
MIHPNMKFTVAKCFPHLSSQSGDVGIELEVEGENLPATVTGWETHTENSLRGAGGRIVREGEGGTDIPREYTTRGSYTLSSLMTHLSTLNKALTAEGVKVNLTPRASTHIHVNVQRGTLRDYFGFILYFTILEPVLLRLCGTHRNGNLFCVPTSEAADIPAWINRCVPYITAGQFNYWPSEDNGNARGKYGAINTDPVTRFGSVEVRCFPNSVDPTTIYQWANWLTTLRRLAQTWGTETYHDMFENAVNNPNDFAGTIFTGANLPLVIGPEKVAELIEIGAENSYEIWKALSPVFNFDEKAKKKKKPIPEDELIPGDAFDDHEDPIFAAPEWQEPLFTVPMGVNVRLRD